MCEENKIKCHDNCFNCSSSSSNENGNMNCIVCKDNFYKMNGTNDCFDVSLLKDGFYLKNNIFYPCEDNCLTCSDRKKGTSNNCLSCESENSGLYLVEDQKNCEYSNFTGYYLDKNSKTLKNAIRVVKHVMIIMKLRVIQKLRIIIVLNVLIIIINWQMAHIKKIAMTLIQLIYGKI